MEIVAEIPASDDAHESVPNAAAGLPENEQEDLADVGDLVSAGVTLVDKSTAVARPRDVGLVEIGFDSAGPIP